MPAAFNCPADDILASFCQGRLTPVKASAVKFTISDLASEFDITPRTIRFWEVHGIVAPERDGGKRVFSRRDRTRLKLALRGKRLGLSLPEIRELIDMHDTLRDDRAQLRRVLEVLAKRRSALEQQREDIEAVLGEIADFETRCRDLLDEPASLDSDGKANFVSPNS
jgi:DNA-binding transcriptional MerR regulator